MQSSHIMVIMIVTIVMVASVFRAKYGYHRSRRGQMPAIADPDNERMREEIKTLKERIAVLERLATDTNSAVALDREIEKLR